MSKQSVNNLKSVEAPKAPVEATKSIKNYSLQGLTVILKKGNDFENVWLSPKQSIRVLESQITQQIKNLHKRRLIVIGN
jgi:hypothetical protein